MSEIYYDVLTSQMMQLPNGRLIFQEDSPKFVREQINQGIKRFVDSPSIEHPLVIKTCPFCHSSLIVLKHLVNLDAVEAFEEEFFDTGYLEHCKNCVYWRWHFLRSLLGDRGVLFEHTYISYLSKIREFEVELPAECLSEISQQIRRKYSFWNIVAPYSLEKLVADIFKANYQNAEVIHIGKPDDGGVDVLFIDTSNCQWLVQVKRRSNELHAEGVNTIRNLLGAMLLENSNYGMVVSTADHFSYRAYEAVGRAEEIGMTIKLIDKGKINRMLDTLLPDRPWFPLLRRDFPDEFIEYFAREIPTNKQFGLFEEVW